jgi:molybdopterin converting factor small subunit
MASTITVWLPASLVALFPGSTRHVEVEAGSVDAMMDALDRRWPGMRDRLCDSRPAVRRHINVFVNGERVGLDALLPAGTEVTILTAISGG